MANSNEAMREALNMALNALLGWQLGQTTRKEHNAAVVAIKAALALAAPPRNCERFKTKEEAEVEFMMSDGLPRDGGDTKMRAWMCRFIDWLFAPATERKGETDAK